MSFSRMIICFLILCLPPAICQAVNEEKFSTDWITPPIDSISFVRDVCAIELAIHPRGQGWSGIITLYSGQPAYDVFGDADKRLLQATTLAIEFRKSKAEQTPSGPEQQHLRRSLHYTANGDTKLELLNLVLNFEQPGECRLLVEAVEGGNIQRVLSLQSERRQHQANQYQKSDVSSLSLESDLFIRENRLNQIPPSATDSDLEELKNFTNLDALQLDGADSITDAGLAKLVSLKLKSVSLMHNRNVTDTGVRHLSKIESLESLNLWHCANLTNRSVEALKQLPNLRKINFFGTKIDPNFFRKEIPNCMLER